MKKKETKSINLPTCRVKPSEAIQFKKFLMSDGFEKPSHFWRMLFLTYLAQKEAGNKIEFHPLKLLTRKGSEHSKVATLNEVTDTP